jgi:hypothetical protein
MKLNTKEYQKIKTKKYLKKNRLFFFLNGVNRNSNDWRKTKQSLVTMGFMFFKSFNKITNKELKNSTFKNLKEIVNGPTFLIKPKAKTQLYKNVLLSKFFPLLFILLIIKINNKIYPLTVFKKNINEINYTNNALLFYQFNVTHLKHHTIFIEKINYSK